MIKAETSCLLEYNEEYINAPHSTPDIITLMNSIDKNLFLGKDFYPVNLRNIIEYEDIDEINDKIGNLHNKANLQKAERNNFLYYFMVWLTTEIIYMGCFGINIYLLSFSVYTAIS